MMNKKMKFTMITNNINCERHTQYSYKIKQFFLQQGFEYEKSFDVDKVLIMGCGFHNHMYDKVIAAVDLCQESGVSLDNIFVLGCLPKTHESLLHEKGIKTFPFYHEELLEKEIHANSSYKDVDEINVFNFDKDSILNSDYYYIRVAEGCLRQCTFCVINKAKGSIHSIAKEKIMEQYREALAQGYKKIFLMGEDTFAYGYDNGESITDLLYEMLEIDPEVKFYFGSLHCRWIVKYAKEMIDLCEKKRINNIHIGIQHVNEQVLERMGRYTDWARVYEVLKEMKRVNPDLKISCDILVGFPGETKEQFKELCDFFEQDNVIGMVSHYGYSDVNGAKSASFENKLSPIEISIRWNMLNKILNARSGYRKTFEDDKNLVKEKNYYFI